MENTLKTGQILYHEDMGEESTLKSASLFYIDEGLSLGKQLMITWIAQMKDFEGNGLEVYTDATAGGAGKKYITRIATDKDIKTFVDVIKGAKNFQEELQHWIINIDEAEDFALLLPEEKVRLKKLITT